MFLVLTYHRIVPDPAAIADFFDVTAEELQRHISLVKRYWGVCVPPGALPRNQSHRDNHRMGFQITFDDGTEDHYTRAATVLERNEVRGVFFVNTARFARPGYLTVQQCQELQARGHAVESHSHDHKRLTTLPPGSLHRQLAESRRRLRDLGLGRWDFLAPPGGCLDCSVQQAARAEGYQLVRTLRWGYNRLFTDGLVESITVNRSTAGLWFRAMASPRLEGVKKAVYRTKEAVKNSGLETMYVGLREFRSSRRNAGQSDPEKGMLAGEDVTIVAPATEPCAAKPRSPLTAPSGD